MNLRTEDTSYGEDYWSSLDGGNGYQDSTMWEDLAMLTKEVVAIDEDGNDTSNGKRGLDIGCGYGYSVRHLRRRGLDVLGVDLSTYAINHSPADVRNYVLDMDITSNHGLGFQYKPETFDFVTCFETMEHIPEESVDFVFSQIWHIMQPRGMGLFTICTDAQEGWDTDPTHITIKPAAWWADKFSKLSFGFLPEKRDFLRLHHLYAQHEGVFVVYKD